jgi:acetyl esterase/lipase
VKKHAADLAAVAQRSHDEGIPLRAQVPVYPMIDDRAVLRDDHAAAWVGVGDLDLFYDEDVDYAEKLRPAGSRANSSRCRTCITVRTVSRRKPSQCRTFGAA